MSELENLINTTNSRVDAVGDDIKNNNDSLKKSIEDVGGRVSVVTTLLEGAKSQIQGSIDDIKATVKKLQDTVLLTEGYIRTGELYRTDADIPVYGVEVGQFVEDNGVTVFRKYARFIAEKLSFFDANDNEVAYISDRKLYITQVEVKGSFLMGGFIDKIQSDGSIVTKWVGTGG